MREFCQPRSGDVNGNLSPPNRRRRDGAETSLTRPRRIGDTRRHISDEGTPVDPATIPLLVAVGLAVVWLSVIFYGVQSLYRRTSPLFIVYWGTWLCFILWYLTWVKKHHLDGMSKVVLFIVAVFAVLGAIFGMFSADDSQGNANK